MRRNLLALLAAAFPLMGSAAWIEAGMRASSLDEGGAREHFGAQLVLTGDESHFKTVWASEAALSALPQVGSIRRGATVSAVLVFQGCQADAAGRCDVVASFFVISPSGTYLPGGSAELWSGLPVPGRLHLGNASMDVSFDARDPAGRYRVFATVRDRVSGRTLNVSSTLQVE